MDVKSMTFLLYLLYCSKQIPAMIKTAQASKEVQITNILNSSNDIINLLVTNVLTKVEKCSFL